jgi:hypothetical protein
MQPKVWIDGPDYAHRKKGRAEQQKSGFPDRHDMDPVLVKYSTQKSC